MNKYYNIYQKNKSILKNFHWMGRYLKSKISKVCMNANTFGMYSSTNTNTFLQKF